MHRIVLTCLMLLAADGLSYAQQTSTLPSASRSTFLKLTRVQEYWEEENFVQAFADLQELAVETRDKPYDFALTNQYLAHTSILAGEPARARRALEAALTVSGLPEQMEADLKLFYGQVLVGDEDFEEALGMLEDWLATTQSEPLPGQVFYVAYANYMTGNLARAQPLIERAIDEATTRNDSWDRLYYQILFEQKLYEQAEVVILDILDRNPAEDSYWRLLVNHYMQLEDSKQALSALAIANMQNPMQEPADVRRLVSLYGYVEIPEKAARLLEGYLQTAALPSDAENLKQLGDLWLLARERGKAKVVLERAAAMAPDGRTYQLLGGVFFEDEEWENAYRAFDEALELGGLDEPARVANLVAFLCREEASDITGAAIPIDRGRSSTWLDGGG